MDMAAETKNDAFNASLFYCMTPLISYVEKKPHILLLESGEAMLLYLEPGHICPAP